MHKLTLLLIFFSFKVCLAQSTSIFFLKDGSIIQGKVVNENQHRIFLKTEQGTIKILPLDVIGREDSAKKGDLTFMSEKIDYLQGNVTHLTGKVTHWNDSLKTVFDNLNELFKNLEVLQNEFEIDLLRLYSESTTQKKKMEYVQDDLVNHRVSISENRQGMGMLKDTVSTINNDIIKVKQKLDVTSNQSYLLTGNLSNIKKDIQVNRENQKLQRDQIDMMSGAVANQIQEVNRVQSSFSAIENAIEENKNTIKGTNNKIDLKTSDIEIQLNQLVISLNNKNEILDKKINDIDKKNIKDHEKFNADLGDLKNDILILDTKLQDISRDLKVSNEKISKIDDVVNSLNSMLIKLESSIKDINISITKMDSKIISMDKKIDTLPINEK